MLADVIRIHDIDGMSKITFISLEALAATLNEEPNTLIDVVEPFLLQKGFVLRSPSGRKIGEAARKHLKFAANSNEQPRLL